MDITASEYHRLCDRAAPASPILIDCLKAFGVGGLICAVGQTVATLAQNAGVDQKTASLCGSLFLVLVAVALTGLRVFDNIAKHAGAGTFVPITGFANAIASPAIEFKSEGLVLGMAAKMFVIAGPVLVYGIAASVLYGVIMCLLNLV